MKIKHNALKNLKSNLIIRSTLVCSNSRMKADTKREIYGFTLPVKVKE